MEINNSVLVMSHMDDELLFSSSILDQVKTIIIVFTECDDQELSKKRFNFKKKYPFSNCIFLDIRQGEEVGNFFFLLFGKETNYGISFRNKKRYKSNYLLIKNYIKKLINEYNIIFTHNPWGEYGNHEHIQIYRIMRELALENNLKLFVNNYCSYSASWLMYINQYQFKKNIFIVKQINQTKFEEIKDQFIKSGCWTYCDSYKPPMIEIFYQIDLEIENNYKKISRPKSLETSKISINLINSIIFKKSNFIIFPKFFKYTFFKIRKFFTK